MIAAAFFKSFSVTFADFFKFAFVFGDEILNRHIEPCKDFGRLRLFDSAPVNIFGIVKQVSILEPELCARFGFLEFDFDFSKRVLFGHSDCLNRGGNHLLSCGRDLLIAFGFGIESRLDKFFGIGRGFGLPAGEESLELFNFIGRAFDFDIDGASFIIVVGERNVAEFNLSLVGKRREDFFHVENFGVFESCFDDFDFGSELFVVVLCFGCAEAGHVGDNELVILVEVFANELVDFLVAVSVAEKVNFAESFAAASDSPACEVDAAEIVAVIGGLECGKCVADNRIVVCDKSCGVIEVVESPADFNGRLAFVAVGEGNLRRREFFGFGANRFNGNEQGRPLGTALVGVEDFDAFNAAVVGRASYPQEDSALAFESENVFVIETFACRLEGRAVGEVRSNFFESVRAGVDFDKTFGQFFIDFVAQFISDSAGFEALRLEIFSDINVNGFKIVADRFLNQAVLKIFVVFHLVFFDESFSVD